MQFLAERMSSLHASAFAALVLLALCSSASAQFQNPFVGQWTAGSEGYDFTTYICVSGNQMWGFYSQVGTFRGTITGDVFTGTWFEGGEYRLAGGGTTKGSITLRVVENNETADNLVGEFIVDGAVTDIYETRIDKIIPLDEQCWFDTETSQSIQGQWISGDHYLWLCLLPTGEYFGSYQYMKDNETKTGFTRGVGANDLVLRGTW